MAHLSCLLHTLLSSSRISTPKLDGGPTLKKARPKPLEIPETQTDKEGCMHYV